MAKSKTAHVLVLMKSVVSRHLFPAVRHKQADKLEMIKFDPYVQKDVLYREIKKIKSVRYEEPKY